MWILNGSVPLGTFFGIRVRMHASLLILMIVTLLFAGTPKGLGVANAVTSMTILFFAVLLHEFGHCFGARWVGGRAEEILMWPLGGLAFTEPPHRPWPSFITTAAGPFVNFAICVITGVLLYVLSNSASAIPWFPVRQGLKSYVPHDNTTYYIWWIFLVNYAVLTFNMMLVFYPFDAGRMVQEILWWRIGYYRSMMIATVIGMIGAGIVGMIGLAGLSLTLILIAVFGFYTCWQQRIQLKEMGPEEWQDGTDYSAAYEPQTPKKSRMAQWRLKRARKRALNEAHEERVEQAKIDAILAKVSSQGMHSLNWMEKRTLKKATERQRQSESARRRH